MSDFLIFNQSQWMDNEPEDRREARKVAAVKAWTDNRDKTLAMTELEILTDMAKSIVREDDQDTAEEKVYNYQETRRAVVEMTIEDIEANKQKQRDVIQNEYDSRYQMDDIVESRPTGFWADGTRGCGEAFRVVSIPSISDEDALSYTQPEQESDDPEGNILKRSRYKITAGRGEVIFVGEESDIIDKASI